MISIEEAVEHLSSFERPSASEGERRAAEWIAERLRELGCEARVEPERAHGGYWWPIGLLNAAAGAAALRAVRHPSRVSRAFAAGLGAFGATALWDDLGHGRRWFRRTFLPHRTTFNVVAQAGDHEAERTVVLVAHHDAAHSGLVFHPAPGWLVVRRLPRLHARSNQTVPILFGVWLGPALVAAAALAGRRRVLGLGTAFCAGTVAAMADVALRPVVPGANDNLSAVAVLLAVAEALRDRPVEGVRVLLVSTGSEESFSEGMQAFGERHFGELARESTEMVCLECVGSPHLVALRGEGMLRMRDYPHEAHVALVQAAHDAGVQVGTNLRTVAATDAIIALRAGYRVATLAAVDDRQLPANYHWPTDTPANLDWSSIRGAIAVCEAFVRGRA